ncbi:unnamed protein product [Candidula unifasciata]|uniref:Uncharacterized protein n=1 Tax=Candidula unifasciata TaxID=100452 RepID=A0A8S4A7S5_9EUPU|nr:unnamed protein product [Candidula unifasciata]
MGKDGDRRASQKSGLSVDVLKEEHARLVRREKELDSHFLNVKAIFQKLEETYQSSKGTFSISRYGQLKDMIKGATSDETFRNLQQIMQDTSSSSTSGKGSLSGLLGRAQEFSGEAQEQNKQVEAEATGKSGGKLSSFMKKLKNVTGFSDEPIADEDVMSEAELQRDNARKQRAIQHHLNQFSKALAKLEKLKHDYEASKAHAPPKRYQDLKDMIKITVAEKF